MSIRKPKRVKYMPQRIRIIQCRAMGYKFSNLTPGSEHDTVRPPKPYVSMTDGVWIQGVGEPVKVLLNEYEICQQKESNGNATPGMPAT
jgi:hypothetical protein